MGRVEDGLVDRLFRSAAASPLLLELLEVPMYQTWKRSKKEFRAWARVVRKSNAPLTLREYNPISEADYDTPFGELIEVTTNPSTPEEIAYFGRNLEEFYEADEEFIRILNQIRDLPEDELPGYNAALQQQDTIDDEEKFVIACYVAWQQKVNPPWLCGLDLIRILQDLEA